MPTLGTFMPILVAIAFRETELIWGIVLFIVITAAGLSLRFYLERLQLLLVPRLCSVLVLVVLLMLAISLISGRLGLERGFSVALFPIVIMTMVIEHMSVIWEESGPGAAIKEGIGSLMVAVLGYLGMTEPHLTHLIFVFSRAAARAACDIYRHGSIYGLSRIGTDAFQRHRRGLHTPMFGRIRKLVDAGVVGINNRNRGYIMPRNPRKLYARVDDKVETKRLAMGAGIAVPELYGLISSVHDARDFVQMVEGRNDFVVKPAHGSGGKGILVITERRRGLYVKGDGVALTPEEVEHHIQNVLGGVYSLGGHPDQAIIEYRVKFDRVFEAVSYRGVPDIRVLVYRGVPAMAMLRLPTRKSDGRANLHQGAVGAGIDMVTGLTTFAVCQSRHIIEHPDSGTVLRRAANTWLERIAAALRTLPGTCTARLSRCRSRTRR